MLRETYFRGAVMQMDRRELCSLLPLLMCSAAVAATDSGLASTTFPFAELQPHKNAAGTMERRDIVNGKTPTGERVEIHETTLAPGGMPHAAHHHPHSEFWLVKEGEIEITINGKSCRLGPGSAGFAASNDEHGVKNIGNKPASYFVVAIGPMPEPAKS